MFRFQDNQVTVFLMSPQTSEYLTQSAINIDANWKLHFRLFL